MYMFVVRKVGMDIWNGWEVVENNFLCWISQHFCLCKSTILFVLIFSSLMYIGFSFQCLNGNFLNGNDMLIGKWTSANKNCNVGSLFTHHIGK
jgi:hypothetical protein